MPCWLTHMSKQVRCTEGCWCDGGRWALEADTRCFGILIHFFFRCAMVLFLCFRRPRVEGPVMYTVGSGRRALANTRNLLIILSYLMS
jgi:hypothetical protein